MKVEVNLDKWKLLEQIINESDDFGVFLNVVFSCARNKFGDENIKKHLSTPHIHLFNFLGKEFFDQREFNKDYKKV